VFGSYPVRIPARIRVPRILTEVAYDSGLVVYQEIGHNRLLAYPYLLTIRDQLLLSCDAM
jgi:hypothetical protein